MRNGMRLAVCTGVGAALLFMAGLSSAQVKESKSDDGYGYQFDDDPLNAGGFGPNDATIRVRARAARTTLIRPRISFVPEMLKSVENL
ncbi:MAG TPA: hypothetical protein VFS67_13835 [Polyangiaceae bacterium]|jgi:hypothetical protein|nr:hypothetical protein [Polyangiaceae bacterium]